MSLAEKWGSVITQPARTAAYGDPRGTPVGQLTHFLDKATGSLAQLGHNQTGWGFERRSPEGVVIDKALKALRDLNPLVEDAYDIMIAEQKAGR